MDTKMMDTLFQFNKLNEKKATQPIKHGGRYAYINLTHIVEQFFGLSLVY